MGSSQSAISIMDNYQLVSSSRRFLTISKKDQGTGRFALKTLHSQSGEEHAKRMKYFKEYRQKMDETLDSTRLLDIYQEKNENFCSHDYKIHLVYEYSDITIESEILERNRRDSRHEKLENQEEKCHFGYEDICNLLYTCLSALWTVKEISAGSWSGQLRGYRTLFLTTQDIVLMPDGAIKVLDPYLLQFESRYVNNKEICYSPEKMRNFSITDDQKCSIFELGVTILKISLLESKDSLNLLYDKRSIQQKLQKAKSIYAADIDDTVGISVFDVVAKMVEVERKERFDLCQAVMYAEEMFEQLEQSGKRYQQGNINASEVKKELRRTTHSSSGKKHSPNLQKFYNFKEGVAGESVLRSPAISNFTIEEAERQMEEQSSMLQSLQVQQPVKPLCFNSSVGAVGVFQNVVLNDSYAYHPRFQSVSSPAQKDQEDLFTDPELLMTIKRELQEIDERKRIKVERSRVIERKDRFSGQEEGRVRIRNEVYLND